MPVHTYCSYELECDQCDEVFEGTDEMDLSDVMREATKDGWLITTSLDEVAVQCPEHTR